MHAKVVNSTLPCLYFIHVLHTVKYLILLGNRGRLLRCNVQCHWTLHHWTGAGGRTASVGKITQVFTCSVFVRNFI